MKFVLIPPGEFTMGSTAAEIEAALAEVGNDSDWREYIQSESPRHKVILTKPFYLGVHEVTQAEYEQVLGRERNRSWFAPMGSGRVTAAGMDTGNHPMEMVSWNDATEFCSKLSQHVGDGYRLPTEAQWEFACRAGTTTRFWFGDSEDDLPGAGWFNPNSVRRPHAVGEFPANPFGLHDMHGNVWEWVADFWEPNGYERFQTQPATDPVGAPADGAQHLVRGGHWRSTALICRASARVATTPAFQLQNCAGFRIALDWKAVKAALAKRAR